jgi:hypothetical protein
VAAALGIAAVLAAGTYAIGRSVAEETVAMTLTAVWFGLVGAGAVAAARRRRTLALPLGAGFTVVAVAVGVVLGLPNFVDEAVDERVVTGVASSQARADQRAGGGGGEAGSTDRGDAKPAANVAVASGSFEPLAHPGTGTATVVELAEGGRRLTLTDFETDNGPDLFAYLVAGNPTGDAIGDFVDLGPLKGNTGDQEYAIPDEVDVDEYSTVVIWCRAFTVSFTKAPLERT